MDMFRVLEHDCERIGAIRYAGIQEAAPSGVTTQNQISRSPLWRGLPTCGRAASFVPRGVAHRAGGGMSLLKERCTTNHNLYGGRGFRQLGSSSAARSLPAAVNAFAMASDRGRQFDEYRGAQGLGLRRVKGPKGDRRLTPKAGWTSPHQAD